GGDGERGNEPDTVLRVVGDARVAHDRPRARRLRARRGRGQEAARPRRPAVRREREADVRRAAVEDPPALEHREDGRADGERVRLYLRLVLALWVPVRVAGDLAAHDLAVACDAVGSVRRDDVTATAAGDSVPDAVPGLDAVVPRR